MQKILLIDDQPKLIIEMLTIFGHEVDVALDSFEGLQKLFNAPEWYQIVMLDLDTPGLNGFDIIKQIHYSPETQNLGMIILSRYDSEEVMVKGLYRGADVYLAKPVSARSLNAHIQALLRRLGRNSAGTWEQNNSLNKNVELLTVRENEILKLLVRGYSNQKIAASLVISETTVKNHLANIFKKLNVANRTQAAYLAQKMKLS